MQHANLSTWHKTLIFLAIVAPGALLQALGLSALMTAYMVAGLVLYGLVYPLAAGVLTRYRQLRIERKRNKRLTAIANRQAARNACKRSPAKRVTRVNGYTVRTNSQPAKGTQGQLFIK